jgi:uncharacterized membrane protein
MSGFGFILRKFYKQDNLSGFLMVCFHSAIASTGPWLFTVIALATIGIIGKGLVTLPVLMDFRTILIYNFAFSLVVSGPVFMVATRYLADCIHNRDVSPATGMLVGALSLIWGIELCIAGIFYFAYANLTFAMAVSAIINFLLVSAVWLVSIFVSALKNYKLTTYAFLFGMVVAVFASVQFALPYGAAGMLNGFSMGLMIIISLLTANILAEYPYSFIKPFGFMQYFKKYPELALSGIIYNIAIWADKWIMWFAPEAMKLKSGLVIYPDYDSAMFIAYLTTIPAMAMFFFNTETNFFEKYLRFHRDIQQKSSYAKIQQNHEAVTRSILGSAGYFFLLQGSIALLGVLMAPEIIKLLNGNYMQIGILRFGLLGAMFQILTLLLLVLLSYFDNRRASLYIQLAFMVMNVLFTLGSMYAGFSYYGYGYFMASFITFIIAAIVTVQYVAKLPYHTFVTTNSSVR